MVLLICSKFMEMGVLLLQNMITYKKIRDWSLHKNDFMPTIYFLYMKIRHFMKDWGYRCGYLKEVLKIMAILEAWVNITNCYTVFCLIAKVYFYFVAFDNIRVSSK